MLLSHYSLDCLRGDVGWGLPGGFFVSIFVFRCLFFHPLQLVLFHIVNVSVFSGVLFWHCFCSLCCDLLLIFKHIVMPSFRISGVLVSLKYSMYLMNCDEKQVLQSNMKNS